MAAYAIFDVDIRDMGRDAAGRMLARFGRFGNQDGQFRLAHDLAVASDGAVYVVDAWGQRVQKFIAH